MNTEQFVASIQDIANRNAAGLLTDANAMSEVHELLYQREKPQFPPNELVNYVTGRVTLVPSEDSAT